jgi:hypothetical protein
VYKINYNMENIELSEVCYEQIKDTFYYAIFGDFKLVIDKATGYFNATKLCNSGGKLYYNWYYLEKSKQIVEYYKKSPKSITDFSYEVEGDNNNVIEEQIIGTYTPKDLILDIASWVSIQFYDKCNKIILNYFVKEIKIMDYDTLKTKLKNIEDEMDKLALENVRKEYTICKQKDMIDQLLDSTKRLEKYIISLGISLEKVKDQNEELLDLTKILNVNWV